MAFFPYFLSSLEQIHFGGSASASAGKWLAITASQYRAYYLFFMSKNPQLKENHKWIFLKIQEFQLHKKKYDMVNIIQDNELV